MATDITILQNIDGHKRRRRQGLAGSTTCEHDGVVSWLRYKSASLSDQVRKINFHLAVSTGDQ